MSDRYEVMPFGSAVQQAADLPERAHLTVTCSPKHGPDESIEIARQLHAFGHRVTVHLAARMVDDAAHLDRLLAAMKDAGLEEAFVIGGDATPPHGPFSSAVELLPLVAGHGDRPGTIGIGGYPEGHPLIDDAALADALARKAPFADYVTTQLCFDPDAVLAWIRTIRSRGIDLPVFAGIPGIVDRAKLLEISMRVGVGPSVSFLRKQGGLRNLLRLSRSSADRLFDALAPHDELAGFHYYTFNRLRETWTWVQGKRAATTTISEHAKEVT
ncbi:MAG TPA: methylenetetrahydrofolate reductase [Gaiellaceae bacterium]|nr:methylenetetrahydrofolate reductase [Gaiellaceae bacterium]